MDGPSQVDVTDKARAQKLAAARKRLKTFRSKNNLSDVLPALDLPSTHTKPERTTTKSSVAKQSVARDRKRSIPVSVLNSNALAGEPSSITVDGVSQPSLAIKTLPTSIVSSSPIKRRSATTVPYIHTKSIPSSSSAAGPSGSSPTSSTSRKTPPSDLAARKTSLDGQSGRSRSKRGSKETGREAQQKKEKGVEGRVLRPSRSQEQLRGFKLQGMQVAESESAGGEEGPRMVSEHKGSGFHSGSEWAKVVDEQGLRSANDSAVPLMNRDWTNAPSGSPRPDSAPTQIKVTTDIPTSGLIAQGPIHKRGHSRSHSRHPSTSTSAPINEPLAPGTLLPRSSSGENTPPAQAGMMINTGFTFGKPSEGGKSLQPEDSTSPSSNAHARNQPNRRGRTHSRQLSSISGLLAFAPAHSPSRSTTWPPSSDAFEPTALPVYSFGGTRQGMGTHTTVTSLRADDSSASASGSSGSEDSPTEAVFSFGKHGEQKVEQVTQAGSGHADSAVGLEMPTFSFGVDSPPDATGLGQGFSFPQRHFEDGMRFRVASTSPELSIDTARARDPLPHLVIPSFAIVPSTPLSEESRGEDFPFVFPDIAVEPPADDALTAQARFGTFTFGRPSDKAITSSVSSPVLGSAFVDSTEGTLGSRRRHSHTRSSSVSGYAALSGTFGLEGSLISRSYPASPVRGSLEELASSELSTEEIRRQALQSLEGKREGLKLSVDWSSREADLTGQRNSWGAQRRRQRSSTTDKVEIALPTFDEDDGVSASLPITPSPASPDSPTRIQQPFSAPSSPSRFSFPAGPQSYRRDSFGKIVPLIESSPFGLAGLGIAGASTSMASVATPLRTLLEEEEEDEENEAPSKGIGRDIDLHAAPPIASPPAPPASAKFRPLRLLSISSSIGSNEAGSVTEGGRRSSSIDRDTENSLESLVLSPPLGRSSEDVLEASRRNSLARRSRAGSVSRPLWRRRMSAGSVSSSTTNTGSVKIFHEVGQEEATDNVFIDDMLISATSEATIINGKRYSRSSNARYSIGSANEHGDAGMELLQRALEAEAENQAMQEDILGWQERVRKLESKLESEREHGRLLRERVRKLGDHLSAMSSMNVPPSSPPARTSMESSRSEESAGPTLSQLQAQLFALAASVETERREKMQALAESQALRDELHRERNMRESLEEQTLTRSSAPDVRPESVVEGEFPDLSMPPLQDNSVSSLQTFSFGRQESDSQSETSDRYHHSPDLSAQRPDSPPSFSFPSIPILLNDDGQPVEIPSGPPTPEPDSNFTRIRSFAFPTIRRPSTRPKSIADPFFELNIPMPDSASPVEHSFGKVFGRSPNPEEGGWGGLGAISGLPPIQVEAGGVEREDELGPAPFDLGFERCWEVQVDFSRSCSCCDGPVFDL